MKKLVFIFFTSLVVEFAVAQYAWTQKANFGGNVKQQAIGFSIGNYGYLGLGYEISYVNDLWQYDPALNVWNSKASFPGGCRWANVAFSIGNSGFVATGFCSSSNNFFKDLWEYNSLTNIWTKKTDLPAGARWHAVGFSIGAKGYVGLGFNTATTTAVFYNDLWEYDAATNTWASKASLPVIKNGASAFVIGNKAYIVGDVNGSDPNAKDMWMYDQVSNVWTMVAPYPGNGAGALVTFSFGGYGFVGAGRDQFTGLHNDFYRYDPLSNTWTPIAFCPGPARWMSVGFNIGNKGYMATGNIGTTSPFGDLKDLWELSLQASGETEFQNNTDDTFSIYPNPTGNTAIIKISNFQNAKHLKIYNSLGQEILNISEFKDEEIHFERRSMAKGIYSVHLFMDNNNVQVRKLLISE